MELVQNFIEIRATRALDPGQAVLHGAIRTSERISIRVPARLLHKNCEEMNTKLIGAARGRRGNDDDFDDEQNDC